MLFFFIYTPTFKWDGKARGFRTEGSKVQILVVTKILNFDASGSPPPNSNRYLTYVWEVKAIGRCVDHMAPS